MWKKEQGRRHEKTIQSRAIPAPREFRASKFHRARSFVASQSTWEGAQSILRHSAHKMERRPFFAHQRGVYKVAAGDG